MASNNESALTVLTWWLPAQGFGVNLRVEVAEALERRILAAATAGGARASGLLTGWRDVKGNFFVEDAIPVPDGPDAGRVLEDVRARMRSEGRRPMGYYRRHDADIISLDDRDLSIVRTSFTSPDSLILLLKPTPDGRIEAGFFFWVDDTLSNELLHPPMAFSAAPRRAGIESREEAAIETLPPVPPPAAPVESAPAPFRPIPRLPVLSRGAAVAGAAALGVLLILAAAVGIGRVNPRTAPVRQAAQSASARPLGMDVDPQARGLRVTWDRANLEILAAQRALLEVTDGGQSERIALDPDQLRSGAVIYFPKTGDITLRLTVFRDAKPYGMEVVRIVGYAPAPPPETARAGEAEPAGATPPPPPAEAAPRPAPAPAVKRETAAARRTLPPIPSPAAARPEPLAPPVLPAAPGATPLAGIQFAAAPPVTAPDPAPLEPELRDRSPLRSLGGGIARAGRRIGRFLAGEPEPAEAPAGQLRPARAKRNPPAP